MVERQLRKRGIHDERVLAAMAQIPREEFLPLECAFGQYQDGPVGNRRRANHFAAVHDRADGAGTGIAAAERRCSKWGQDAATRPRCWGRCRRGWSRSKWCRALAEWRSESAATRRATRTSTVVRGDGGGGYGAARRTTPSPSRPARPTSPRRWWSSSSDRRTHGDPGGICADQELRVIVKQDGKVESHQVHAMPVRSAARPSRLALMRLRTSTESAQDRAQHHRRRAGMLERLLAANRGDPVGDSGSDPARAGCEAVG